MGGTDPNPPGRQDPHLPLPLVVLWLALVAGLAEVAALEFRQHIQHLTIARSRQIVWLTPLSYLVMLTVPGLALAVAARIRPRLVPLRRKVFLLSLLACFGFLFVFYPGLHKASALLLALGISVQLARMAHTRSPALARLMRRSTPWMLALVALMTLWLNGSLMLRDRRARAAVGQAAAGAPNVLLIILDTVRELDLSVYGYHRPTTPELARFAATGVRFDRAIATAPWTLPSHATLFTGRYPWQLSADWLTPLDATYPTLSEVLGRHGYVSGGFVANLSYTSFAYGLDRGFAHYEDYHASLAELLLYSSLGRFVANSYRVRRLVGYYDVLDRKHAPEVSRELLRWLGREQSRPYFVFLNYMDAHLPYFPPAPFDSIFGRRPAPPHLQYWLNGADHARKWELTPDQVRAEQNAYDGSIAALDHQVGALLDELRRRGELENTIVIVASDHGEQFGEHGLQDHGNSLYLPLLRVPLLIAWPGRVPAGSSVVAPVSLRDLPATVLDLAGIRGGTLPGTSLARFWDRARFADTAAATPVLSMVRSAPRSPLRYPTAKGDMYSLVRGEYHYILNGDGGEELYDMEADPLETVNLAGTEPQDTLLPVMRASVEATRHPRSP